MSIIDTALGGRYSSIELENDKTYRFDKVIFLSIVVLLLGFSIVALNINNFDKSQHFYVKCNDIKCFNPYFNNTAVCGSYISTTDPRCTTEVLSKGDEYGKPEPWYVNSFGMIAIILVACGFLTNHFIYNRKVLGGIKDVN